MGRINIDLIPNDNYVDEKGNLKKDETIKFGGIVAGICYDKEGYEHIKNEPEEKTKKRIDRTLGSGHHSVYDHTNIMMNLKGVPKIIAMVLNNEKQYTTSEKSARYTPVVRSEDSIITSEEERLYNKWIDIFIKKITAVYGGTCKFFSEDKIRKLAQENARYLVTVFMPTQMVYTTSFRQINYIASFMDKYIKQANKDDYFEATLAAYMKEFLEQLSDRNILEERLMKNEKYRSLSLFGKDLDQQEIYFGNVYSTFYEGSFAQLAQAQRHRSLKYQMERKEEQTFYVPEILKDDPALVDEWLNDINSVAQVVPQGELVKIYEMGDLENFILKTKERLCTNAQQEIMVQTRKTLLQYKDALEKKNSPLYKIIEAHSYGARCTFPDYDCLSTCGVAEGISLTRKI